MVVNIPLELISHTRKICSLYKRWLRNLEAFHFPRHDYRFEACLARVRFEKLANERDMMKAKQMMEDMEEELFQNMHPQPKYFPSAVKGVEYGRVFIQPDYLADYWHPLEKSVYPEFFARRELRKQQYIEMWERQHRTSENKEKKK